jgi:anti-sigma B factor antagonist
MSEMSMQVTGDSDTIIMKLTGQMRGPEAEEFDQEVRKVIDRKPSVVVLDMSAMTMITSAGLGALLKLQRRSRDAKCTMRLAALPDTIADVMRKAQLDQILSISPTVQEAAQS